ncbi:unnamed protein product [Trifolium pratense]|uniref:Uncharacterized protein n=1 Tax=Trifolium pratense TaxID=57577 RepID=A0ACB0LJ97_TRIPR|nr:unnamed protein product [Trifolium pratense]
MLFKTEDEDKHKIECNSQKTSFDDLGQQANNSNDCAIWVITWMEKMKADVYKIDVDDRTRLRVALNLTMNSYNKLNDEILARSMQQIDKRGKA